MRAATTALAMWMAIGATVVFAQTKPTTVPAPSSSADFAKALTAAKPGDVVLTPFTKLEDAAPFALAITPRPDAAKLVFSDRPEYFRAGDGIASQDEVKPGRIRFYNYHVPVLPDGKPRRVLTLIENLGDAEAHIVCNSHSDPKPSGDYNAIAKEAIVALLSDTGKGDAVKIPAHDHDVADNFAPVSKPDLLVHSLMDFTTDQPLRITVAQVTASDNLEADTAKIAALPKLPMLPYGVAKDKSGRGVFPCADFDVTLADNAVYDTKSGPMSVPVANGKSDPWLDGIDGISGDATTNKGNYGVLYHIKLKFKSSDGRGVAVLLSANHYEKEKCGFIGTAVKINDGKNPGGVIPLPREAVRFHGLPEACVMQTYDAPKDGSEGVIDFVYTPPGACCIPTPILIVPIDQ